MDNAKEDDFVLELTEAERVGFDEASALSYAADRLYGRAEKLDKDAGRLLQVMWGELANKYNLDLGKYRYGHRYGKIYRVEKVSLDPSVLEDQTDG